MSVMQEQVHLIISDSLTGANLPGELMTQGADVRHVIKDQIGIADARLLIEQSSSTPLTSGAYTFIVFTQSITGEAQNALLKLLEEPPLNVAIYFIIPHESILISTLKSRFVTTTLSPEGTSDESSVQDFLSAPVASRLAMIADKAKNKDTKWLESMVTNLGRVLTLPPQAEKSLVYQSLALVESYIRIRGASKKMLLEELALSIPVKAN